MSDPFETMVRVYKSVDDYNGDARKLAKDRWQVISSTERRPRSGCLRLLMFGLLRPPKPEIVVTYQRAKAQKGAKPSASPPQSGPNFCPNCGQAVKPDTKFCANCRQQLR